MIKLELKRDGRYWDPTEISDGQHIVELFAERGYEISLIDAIDSWQQHSTAHCAGWLFLPDDDEATFNILFSHFENPKCKSEIE